MNKLERYKRVQTLELKKFTTDLSFIIQGNPYKQNLYEIVKDVKFLINSVKRVRPVIQNYITNTDVCNID